MRRPKQGKRIDENGVLRHGTAAFRGGAKVYLCGKEYDFGRDSIDALGLSRGKRLQVIWTPREQIENLRLQKVYRTGILYIMNDLEFARYWWGDTDADKRDAEGFIRRWNWHKEHDKKGSAVDDFDGRDTQMFKCSADISNKASCRSA